MRVSDGMKICEVCGKKVSIIYCDGCVKALCADCRFFTLWPEGCGSAHAKVFCEPCIESLWVNPYGGKMR